MGIVPAAAPSSWTCEYGTMDHPICHRLLARCCPCTTPRHGTRRTCSRGATSIGCTTEVHCPEVFSRNCALERTSCVATLFIHAGNAVALPNAMSQCLDGTSGT